MSAGPELRSRRAALTEDAALVGGFGLVATYSISAAIAQSGLQPQDWAALGLGLGAVVAWPGPWQHRTARIIFSTALITLPLFMTPFDLGTLLHLSVLDGTALNAPQLTGALGVGLLGLGLWGRHAMGNGVWRRQQALGELGRELPGWQILRSVRTGPWNRVLSAPDGGLITLHVAAGQERGRGVRRVTWPEPTEAQLSRRIWPGSSVLWVTLPHRRPAVVYIQEHWDGGLTWPATTAELSELLWSSCALARPTAAVPVPESVRPGKTVWFRTGKPPRPPTPAQIRAAGVQVWADVPGLFNVPGALSCRPQPHSGLPGGVFTFGQPGLDLAVCVGVWPHPDPPSPAHPDQRTVTGLRTLLAEDPATVVWAPLMTAQDQSTGTDWIIGGVPVITAALMDRLQPAARRERQRARSGAHNESHSWSGPGENAAANPGVPGLNANDPYQVLGVSRTASAEEIRKAWRTLVLDWHPDRTQRLAPAERKAAEAHFRTINAAYDSLKRRNQGA